MPYLPTSALGRRRMRSAGVDEAFVIANDILLQRNDILVKKNSQEAG
jgi:hypothetical protein